MPPLAPLQLSMLANPLLVALGVCGIPKKFSCTVVHARALCNLPNLTLTRNI